jgi:hypothetical protein
MLLFVIIHPRPTAPRFREQAGVRDHCISRFVIDSLFPVGKQWVSGLSERITLWFSPPLVGLVLVLPNPLHEARDVVLVKHYPLADA